MCTVAQNRVGITTRIEKDENNLILLPVMAMQYDKREKELTICLAFLGYVLSLEVH